MTENLEGARGGNGVDTGVLTPPGGIPLQEADLSAAPEVTVRTKQGGRIRSHRPLRGARLGLAALAVAGTGGFVALRGSSNSETSSSSSAKTTLVKPAEAAPPTTPVPVTEAPATTEAPDPLQGVKDVAIKAGYPEFASKVTAETKHNTIVTPGTTTEVLNFSKNLVVNPENMAETIKFIDGIPAAMPELEVNPHGDGPIKVKLRNIAPNNRYVIILDPEMTFRRYGEGSFASTFMKPSGSTVVMREPKGSTGDPLYNTLSEWGNSAIANEIANTSVHVEAVVPQPNSSSTFQNSIGETVNVAVGKVVGGKQAGIPQSAVSRYLDSSSFGFDGNEEHDPRPIKLANVAKQVYPTAPAGPVLVAVA